MLRIIMLLFVGGLSCDINTTPISKLEKIIEPQLIRYTFDDIFETHPQFKGREKNAICESRVC